MIHCMVCCVLPLAVSDDPQWQLQDVSLDKWVWSTLILTDLIVALKYRYYTDTDITWHNISGLNNLQGKAALFQKLLVIITKVLKMMMAVSSLLAASQEYSKRIKRPSRGWRRWVQRSLRRSHAMRWCLPCSSTPLSASLSLLSPPSCISSTTSKNIRSTFQNTLSSSFSGRIG